MPICAIFKVSEIVADRGPGRRFANRLCGGSLATLRQRGAGDSIPRTGSAVALRGGVRKRHDSTEVDLTTGLRSVPNSEARKRASARNRMPARCRRRRGACAMFLRKPGSRCRKSSGRRQKAAPRPGRARHARWFRVGSAKRRSHLHPSRDAKGRDRNGRRMSILRRSDGIGRGLAFRDTPPAIRSNRPPGTVDPAGPSRKGRNGRRESVRSSPGLEAPGGRDRQGPNGPAAPPKREGPRQGPREPDGSPGGGARVSAAGFARGGHACYKYRIGRETPTKSE